MRHVPSAVKRNSWKHVLRRQCLAPVFLLSWVVPSLSAQHTPPTVKSAPPASNTSALVSFDESTTIVYWSGVPQSSPLDISALLLSDQSSVTARDTTVLDGVRARYAELPFIQEQLAEGVCMADAINAFGDSLLSLSQWMIWDKRHTGAAPGALSAKGVGSRYLPFVDTTSPVLLTDTSVTFVALNGTRITNKLAPNALPFNPQIKPQRSPDSMRSATQQIASDLRAHLRPGSTSKVVLWSRGTMVVYSGEDALKAAAEIRTAIAQRSVWAVRQTAVPRRPGAVVPTALLQEIARRGR